MKKVSLLLAFILSFAITAQCGNVLVFEQFDHSYLPSGWSVSGSETGYWQVSETNHAGGTPYEMEFYCHIMGTWRLITNSIDLSDVDKLDVSFKHYYDFAMSAGLTIGIATTSDNGLHWHSGWSQAYNSGGQYQVNASIVTEDMRHPNVKLCIYFTNSNDMNFSYIYIDDFSAFVEKDLDIDLQEINVDEVQAHRVFDVGMRLFNTGNTDVTSVECSYQFNENQTIIQTFNENIPSGTFKNLTFDVPANLIPDTYSLTIDVTKVNGMEDDDMTNNTLTKSVSVACVPTQRKPLFEHFSSSSCGTCPVLSVAMDNFCANNPDKFTYVKYMMNWPPPGDPYYTNEGNVRKTYYGVNQLPWLFMDSYELGINAPTQSQFEEHVDEPSTIEIGGSFYAEGNTIHVTADVMPFVDLSDIRVYVSVNEKITHNNATVNGETSFHHVMMKMLPSAQGTTVSLHAGQLERLTFDYDMSSTHVEEMDDLEVVVWIQRHGSKRVYNSNFLFEAANHPYQPENLKLEKNGTTLIASWSAPSGNIPTGYNIWLNETLAAENVNETSHTFSIAPSEDYHCVQVQAVYGDGITSVKTVATDSETWNLDANHDETMLLYPNPASDLVRIQSFFPVKIMIYNTLGKLIKTYNQTDVFPVTDLPNGLYHVMVFDHVGTCITCKLIINH
ncbi:MAG: T9SS type A sorting domain-containing protein [Bacteroidales bacterium]|nr:T9SS type A sorting domain-containing protein [Bacteroidales bacterium]MBR4148473.1 T9SS type A sorting domain-containing protein [Bacteroidales bacterium]